MYMKILAQRAAYQAGDAVKQDNDKPKYEYDSDEDTEGGTWEHKKRKKEMLKTLGLLVDTKKIIKGCKEKALRNF